MSQTQLSSEISELRSLCAKRNLEFYKAEDALRKLRIELSEIQNKLHDLQRKEADQIRREKQAKEEARYSTHREILKNILVPGQRLKLANTNKNSGFRTFLGWDGDLLVCQSMTLKRVFDPVSGTWSNTQVPHEHNSYKVTSFAHIEIDGVLRFISNLAASYGLVSASLLIGTAENATSN